ncbi:PREDICTED: serine/threonine-protein kinase BUR1-like [Camelina sativa]|uniref:Serine/threonine-protein kinase BUR1-like n=1 Tax=Camelina sativa TaxID=90675 RepID=A0ABM0UAM5_CAMSA|nr:PREDICTED: serine/threonine-protein kinase BUR1-like [Camelina sativa]
MGSTGRDQMTHHHHHPPQISSLVVRPSGSNDGEDGRNAAAGDYELGEVSRDRPSFARSDRYKGENGHRTRASSSSPGRRGYEDHRHGSDLNHSGIQSRGREFSSRREASGRHRDYSPPYARGGNGARPYGRGFDGPESAHGSEGLSRYNNPKVQPRDGDWYCLDPFCRNLNFARRESCNKCKRHRYAAANISPPPRLVPPPMDFSPRRDFNGYRSPPRGWPRDYPPPRLDHPTWRDRDRERDRLHYPDHNYPPSRRIASDWSHTEPLPKPHYDRRPPLSPPHPSRGGRWGRLSRERSRSPPLRDGPPPPLRHGPPPPLRGGGPPPHRDYRRDSYLERGGRDDPRGGRDRMGNSY